MTPEDILDDEKILCLAGVLDDEWLAGLSDGERGILQEKSSHLRASDVECTICSSKNDLMRHILLGVAMCQDCRQFYLSGSWTKGADGSYEFCGWCGNGGRLLLCSKSGCPNCFCVECIGSNVGKKKVRQIRVAKEWKCFECDPQQIVNLRSLYFKYCQEQLEKKRHISSKEPIAAGKEDVIGWALDAFQASLDEAHKDMARQISAHHELDEASKLDPIYVRSKGKKLQDRAGIFVDKWQHLIDNLAQKLKKTESLSDSLPPKELLDLPESENGDPYHEAPTVQCEEHLDFLQKTVSTNDNVNDQGTTATTTTTTDSRSTSEEINGAPTMLSDEQKNCHFNSETEAIRDLSPPLHESTLMDKEPQPSTSKSPLNASSTLFTGSQSVNSSCMDKSKTSICLDTSSESWSSSSASISDNDDDDDGDGEAGPSIGRECAALGPKEPLSERSSPSGADSTKTETDAFQKELDACLTPTNRSESNSTNLTIESDQKGESKPKYEAAVDTIARVIVKRLDENIEQRLHAHGSIRLKDMNEHMSMSDKEDDQIKRLCNLATLTTPSKLAARHQVKLDANKKSATHSQRSSISSTSGDDCDSDAHNDNFSEELAPSLKNSPLLDDDNQRQDEVLQSSCSELDEECQSNSQPNEQKKKSKGKSDSSDQRKERKRQPSFMTTKLTLSDSCDEDEAMPEKIGKKGNGLAKGNPIDEEDDDLNVVKQTKVKKKRMHISSSSSESEKLDEGASGNSEHPGPEPDEKKRKRTSLTDSSCSSGSEELKSKKKRRRIKRIKSTSSESEAQEESPTKSRHNIRKIIKDQDLSELTKEADRLERERRQRIEEKQKLFNGILTQSSDKVLDKLPLDLDPETQEIYVQVDPDLVRHIKPHQAEGIRFMWNAVFESKKDVMENKVPGGAILAHCMGLGKTLQIITLVHTIMQAFPTTFQRVLILCPVNTIKNWVEEFDKWLSGALADDILVHDISTAKDNTDRCMSLKYWMRDGGVMVMGYSLFRNLSNPTTKAYKNKVKEVFQEALIHPGASVVICDEGHILKNCKSALNTAVNRISTQRRIVLTGTPLQNNLSEYFAMVDFVKPKLLGTFREFKNRFVHPIQNGQHSDSTDRDVRIMKKRSYILNDLLKGCMQRLDYNVLVPYLKPKHEYVLSICLSELQKKLYSHYISHFAQGGRVNLSGKLEGGQNGGLFQDVQILSRVWNHPYILMMSKKRSDKKRLLDDDDLDSEAGSLKDFVVYGSDDSSGSDTTSVMEVEEDTEQTTLRRSKRLDVDGDIATDLIGGLDEQRQQAMSNEKTWWQELIPCQDDGTPQSLFQAKFGSKIILLNHILSECEQIGDKVLVFSQSLLSLDLIELFLKEQAASQYKDSETASRYASWERNKDYYRLDGSTSSEERKKWCFSFNYKHNSRARLFLISTKAGGLGINLVAANRVIIFDASWNPAHDMQSIFRVYRFGQTKPVYVYRFLARGTMEEKIYDRQVSKQSLSARVVDEQQIKRHFSINELAELYQFKDESSETRPVPMVPADKLLADMLATYPNLIWKFHNHDSLLENKVDENLTEEERKAAWEEYENERKMQMTMGPNMRAVYVPRDNSYLENAMQLVRSQMETIQAQGPSTRWLPFAADPDGSVASQAARALAYIQARQQAIVSGQPMSAIARQSASTSFLNVESQRGAQDQPVSRNAFPQRMRRPVLLSGPLSDSQKAAISTNQRLSATLYNDAEVVEVPD